MLNLTPPPAPADPAPGDLFPASLGYLVQYGPELSLSALGAPFAYLSSFF